MKDDLNLGNIGNAPKEYDNTFFWRAFRDLEMFISKLLSKGPITVSDLTADKIDTKIMNVSQTLTVGGTMTVGGVPVEPNAYVKKAGDTMTGALNLNSSLYANSNVYITGTVYFNSNVGTSMVPAVNGTYNLGSASMRWGTIYTSDLSLKNEHGDWTIVEGADDLFITNNRTSKKYKFLLKEAD